MLIVMITTVAAISIAKLQHDAISTLTITKKN